MQWRNNRRSKEFYSVKFPLNKHFLAFYFSLSLGYPGPDQWGCSAGIYGDQGSVTLSSYWWNLFPLSYYWWNLSHCFLICESYPVAFLLVGPTRCLLIGGSYPAVFLLERHIPLSSYWWVLSRSVFLLEGPIPICIFIGGSYPAVFLLQGPIPLSSWSCVCSVVLLLVGSVP